MGAELRMHFDSDRLRRAFEPLATWGAWLANMPRHRTDPDRPRLNPGAIGVRYAVLERRGVTLEDVDKVIAHMEMLIAGARENFGVTHSDTARVEAQRAAEACLRRTAVELPFLRKVQRALAAPAMPEPYMHREMPVTVSRGPQAYSRGTIATPPPDSVLVRTWNGFLIIVKREHIEPARPVQTVSGGRGDDRDDPA